jgi:ankyrin repeat protein
MNIKYKSQVILLNTLSFLTVFLTWDAWLENFLWLLHNEGRNLRVNNWTSMVGPVIFYSSNIAILYFVFDRVARLKKTWIKAIEYLNLANLSINVMMIGLIVFIPSENGFAYKLGAVGMMFAMSIVPALNFISMKNFREMILEVEQRVGLKGFNRVMAGAIRDDVLVVHNLIEKGVDINAVDDNGYTPLMYAAANGCYETCRLLIDSGANRDIKTAMGNTAWHFADKNGHSKVATLLSR